jgi:hypothetical protein
MEGTKWCGLGINVIHSCVKGEKEWMTGQSVQQMILGKLDMHMQKNEVKLLHHNQNINSKWIKDLSVET